MVDWLRNNEIPDDIDEPTALALANLTGQPLLGATPREREIIVDDSMEWLRNNSVNPDALDEPKALALEKLTGISIPFDESRENTEKAIDALVDWLRNNEIPADIDEPTAVSLANHLTGQPLMGTTRRERQTIVDDSS